MVSLQKTLKKRITINIRWIILACSENIYGVFHALIKVDLKQCTTNKSLLNEYFATRCFLIEDVCSTVSSFTSKNFPSIYTNYERACWRQTSEPHQVLLNDEGVYMLACSFTENGFHHTSVVSPKTHHLLLVARKYIMPSTYSTCIVCLCQDQDKI